MSKNRFDFITSVLKVFSNGLDLISENLPNALPVYSIILLIIVIFFNSIYLVKAFDTSGDSASCNNNLLSSVINAITWTVIVSTIIFSLTHMRKFLQENLSGEVSLTYGKILGDIFYNFNIIGFIYLLSGFIFSFANNILSNNENLDIHNLLTWIWIPVSIILGLIIVGGIIAIISKKYEDIQNIIGPFIKYLSSFLITISIFFIITLITGTIIYHASRISAEIFGIIFILIFIVLAAMILLFISPNRKIKFNDYLNKYIDEITTVRVKIMEGTNKLLDQLHKARSNRDKFNLRL